MLQELEQLENLVKKGGFDEESREQVKSLRKQFELAVVKESLVKHPSIAPYIQYLKDEVARCKEILSEDEKLTEHDRLLYFERKRQCRMFLSSFGDTAQMEQTIKDLLNVAKSA